MSAIARHVCRSAHRNFPLFTTFSGCQNSNVCLGEIRLLYSSAELGLDGYHRQRTHMLGKIGDLKEKFRGRMEDYMSAAEKNTIFTDDLKTIIYISETVADYETAAKMIKRFHTQNQDLRFSNFVFGPVVMRMLHNLGEAERAYAMFNEKEMDGFFDQMSSFVILMDLLFEKEHYSEVLKVMESVANRQLAGFKYPHDCVTLALASCCKMNTPESFQWMLKLLQDIKAQDTNLSMRSVVYAAKLAYSQSQADTALEILALARTDRGPSSRLPIAYTNLKVLVYVSLGRTEEAIQIVRSVLEKDQPDTIARGNEIFQNTLEVLQQAVDASSDPQFKRQFELVNKGLSQGNHISPVSWEEYIYRPIFRKRNLQDGFKQRRRSDFSGRRQHGTAAYRSGLGVDEDKMLS